MQHDTRENFVFYPSFSDHIEKIKSPKAQLMVFKALVLYGTTGQRTSFAEIDPMGGLDGLFESMCHFIDATKIRRETARQSGRKGGNPAFKRGQRNPYYPAKEEPAEEDDNQEITPDKPKITPANHAVISSPKKISKDKLTDNCKLNTDNCKMKTDYCKMKTEDCKLSTSKKELSEQSSQEEKKFVIPDPIEVATYCVKNHYNIDPELFYSYYAANGWRVGRNPMRDWHAALYMWVQKARRGEKPSIDDEEIRIVKPTKPLTPSIVEELRKLMPNDPERFKDAVADISRRFKRE